MTMFNAGLRTAVVRSAIDTVRVGGVARATMSIPPVRPARPPLGSTGEGGTKVPEGGREDGGARGADVDLGVVAGSGGVVQGAAPVGAA
jgi:hypothetical protein